jgi:ankyrin repeat protein
MSTEDFSEYNFRELDAAHVNNYFAVSSIYKRLKDPSMQNERGQNPYHIAAQFADARAIGFLIDRGVKPVADEDKSTPLHEIASRIGPNSIKSAMLYGERRNDIYRSTELLLEAGADPAVKNSGGETAYVIAAVKGIYPVIQAFADRKAITEAGAEELMPAICSKLSSDSLYEGDLERIRKVISILLEAKILDPERKDSGGMKPADRIKQSKAGAIADLFVKDAEAGKTCGMDLREAVRARDCEAVEALIGNGADPNGESEGETPLMIACGIYHESRAEDYYKIIGLLLDNGGDLNIKVGKNGNTCLHSLMSIIDDQHILAPLDVLLKRGLDATLPMSDGSGTVIHNICGKNWGRDHKLGLLERFLDAGVDPNATDADGNTALMLCAENERYPDMVKLLIDRGADVNMKNNDDQTALMLTSGNTWEDDIVKDIAQIIADAGAKQSGSKPAKEANDPPKMKFKLGE